MGLIATTCLTEEGRNTPTTTCLAKVSWNFSAKNRYFSAIITNTNGLFSNNTDTRLMFINIHVGDFMKPLYG